MIDTLLDVEESGEGVVRCKDCHRVLTDPASRSRMPGPQGPDCWEREHGAPPSRPSRRAALAPDQPALPLDIPADTETARATPPDPEAASAHLSASAAIDVRERPEAIRRALGEHGMPDHLWGLVGWLYGVARDVPTHSRPSSYGEVMGIVDALFDDHDPVND